MTEWLSQVISLFNHTLAAVLAQPVLGLFLGLLVFLAVCYLLIYIFHQGRKGRL